MRIKEESGLTLVEVLASIVIITIILLSFFLIFTQAAKTTQTSNDIFDATYYAQKEMEHLYQLSQENMFVNKEQVITNMSEVAHETLQERDAKRKYVYTKIGTQTFEKLGNQMADSNNHYYYELTWQELSLQLTNIIVKVYDHKDGVLKAQMESIFEWR